MNAYLGIVTLVDAKTWVEPESAVPRLHGYTCNVYPSQRRWAVAVASPGRLPPCSLCHSDFYQYFAAEILGRTELSSELESNFPFVSFRRERAFRVSSRPVPLLRAEGDCASAAKAGTGRAAHAPYPEKFFGRAPTRKEFQVPRS